ncbi:MAG: CoA transferase subunit [Solirubrobacterales bacterium]|nr:CoA transferase subunit [Solirubrobacterales bacterium]
MSPATAERTSALAELEVALADVGDGATIGIGGAVTAAHPMALVRELARRKVRGLTVLAPVAGLDVELLIAAGCVEKLVSCYVGYEVMAGVGPVFRKAARAGTIKIEDIDEGHCVAGLRAAAQRLPFMPWRGGVGTDMPSLNEGIATFTDPVAGEELLAIPAMPLDFALVYAEIADAYGNAQPQGTGNMDLALGSAAETVILQVDRVVPNELIRRAPERTWYWQDTRVVRAPFGTHPYSCATMVADIEHLQEFLDAAGGEGDGLDAYVQRYASADHDSYLEEIGIRRIASLLV